MTSTPRPNTQPEPIGIVPNAEKPPRRAAFPIERCRSERSELDAATHLDEAYRLLLSGNTGVLVLHLGAPVGIVTRIDLIDYWTSKKDAG